MPSKDIRVSRKYVVRVSSQALFRPSRQDHSTRNAQDVDRDSFNDSESVASVTKVVFHGSRAILDDEPGLHIVMKRSPFSPVGCC